MAKKKIQRGISKITRPTGDGAKDSIQAFRCDKEIKALLDLEANKSEVIQKALIEYYSKDHITCPTCGGSGQIRAK